MYCPLVIYIVPKTVPAAQYCTCEQISKYAEFQSWANTKTVATKRKTIWHHYQANQCQMFDLAMSMTLQFLTQRCQWHCGVRTLKPYTHTSLGRESWFRLSDNHKRKNSVDIFVKMSPYKEEKNCYFTQYNIFSLRIQWHYQVGLHGDNDTAELDSPVSMIPRSLTLRYQWHCGTWLCCVNDMQISFWNQDYLRWYFSTSCEKRG